MRKLQISLKNCSNYTLSLNHNRCQIDELKAKMLQSQGQINTQAKDFERLDSQLQIMRTGQIQMTETYQDSIKKQLSLYEKPKSFDIFSEKDYSLQFKLIQTEMIEMQTANRDSQGTINHFRSLLDSFQKATE